MVEVDIEPILQRHPGAGRETLIPILQEVQGACGFLSKAAIMRIGKHLNLPTSKIYGVATFYNQFRFNPPGRYHVQVCRGTACHVKGSAAVLDAMIKELKINPGQTTRDGTFSLEVVACMGACGLVAGGLRQRRVLRQGHAAQAHEDHSRMPSTGNEQCQTLIQLAPPRVRLLLTVAGSARGPSQPGCFHGFPPGPWRRPSCRARRRSILTWRRCAAPMWPGR